MLEEGIVTETHGKIAIVRINKARACAHCKAGCIEQSDSMLAEAINYAEAQAGDTVYLEYNSKMALTAIMIVFGLPLLSLLIGYILAIIISHKQNLSIGAGIFMFFLAFIPIKIYDRHLKNTKACSITVTEILKHLEC